MQTELSQEGPHVLSSSQLSLNLFSYLAEPCVLTSAVLSVCQSPTPSGFLSFLTSLCLFNSIPFHSPCPQLPAFYPDLPAPNTRSLQHSVYSASLSKLPDAPVENHTIVLIGALTNLWVFGSAEPPICSLVGAHSVVSRKLLTAVSIPKCQLMPLPCM